MSVIGRLSPPSLRLILSLLLLATGFFLGAWLTGMQRNLVIMDMQLAARDAAIKSQGMLLRQQRQGRESAHAASSQYIAAQQQIIKLSGEKRALLKQLTDGRVALDGAVVRLLNATGTADIVGAGSVPGDAAAAAVDASTGGFATDTDLAAWIVEVKERFALCRQQIAAIAQFETEVCK